MRKVVFLLIRGSKMSKKRRHFLKWSSTKRLKFTERKKDKKFKPAQLAFTAFVSLRLNECQHCRGEGTRKEVTTSKFVNERVAVIQHTRNLFKLLYKRMPVSSHHMQIHPQKLHRGHVYFGRSHSLSHKSLLICAYCFLLLTFLQPGKYQFFPDDPIRVYGDSTHCCH